MNKYDPIKWNIGIILKHKLVVTQGWIFYIKDNIVRVQFIDVVRLTGKLFKELEEINGCRKRRSQ